MSRELLADILLYDGTGTRPFLADVLIGDGKILQIEPAGTTVFSGVSRFDGTGLNLSPGWIDVHAHSDVSILADPSAFSKISQGITTEVSGNCGLSAFPIINEEVREHLRILYSRYSPTLNWTGFHSFAETVEQMHPAVNQAFLCGHNTLRAAILGYQDCQPDAAQLNSMVNLLQQQLEQGAAGLSTGLLYTPGCFSRPDELLALLRIISRQDRVYATHTRNEGDRLEEALEEAISLAAASGAQLQISHLKTALPRNWHKIDSVLTKIHKAQAAGVRIHADRYPYTYSQTSLSIVLPPPFDRMTDRAIRDCLQQDSALYQQTRDQLAVSGRDWSKVILCSTNVPEAKDSCGLPMDEAARKYHQEPADWVMSLLREDAPGTMAAFGGMSEVNMERILAEDMVCCGTDETARPESTCLGTSHPRGFGSFPRFIRLLRKRGMPMEQIIRRITSLPADIFHWRSRGRIYAGAAADLTLFEEQNLKDMADFAHPHTPAEGIIRVYVNGERAYDGLEKKVILPGHGIVFRSGRQ